MNDLLISKVRDLRNISLAQLARQNVEDESLSNVLPQGEQGAPVPVASFNSSI